jgi:hypothetical protein
MFEPSPNCRNDPSTIVGPVATRRKDTQSVARAIIDVRGYDFGTVEPFRTYTHRFRIQNVGTAPLSLRCTETTSDNFIVDLDECVVPPGKEISILAAWNAQPSDEAFLAKAKIATNDPENPIIRLELLGRTRLLLAANPPSLTALRILPHESRKVETTIVSEHWDSFTIEEVRPSLPGATWVLKRLAPNELIDATAKSGWRLSVTLPPGLPEGTLSEGVTIVARSDRDSASTAELESAPVERVIPLIGKVVRRLSVYGKDINILGTIEAGTLDQNKGFGASYTVRVNDDDPNLKVIDTFATPPFIEVGFAPFRDTVKPGLYRLNVRIPPNTNPAAYIGANQGKLTILFDHPRISELELGVEFVVLGKAKPAGADK